MRFWLQNFHHARHLFVADKQAFKLVVNLLQLQFRAVIRGLEGFEGLVVIHAGLHIFDSREICACRVIAHWWDGASPVTATCRCARQLP